MSWTDSYELPYATVIGRFGSIVRDSLDPDLRPDINPLSGTITLTPTVPYIKINGTVLQIATITAQVVNGVVVNPDGSEGISILSTDVENDTITNWGWRATFKIPEVRITPVSFYAVKDEVIDLANLTSGITGLPVEIVSGPKGDPGPSVTSAVDNGDQTVSFTLSDGTELPPVTLPPGPAGHGVGVNVKRIRKGLLSISGPSVARLKKGLVVVHNSAPPGAPAWSVNPLALMAGRSISTLWYDSVDGMIYSGYGDWSGNGDEIGVVRHRVSTGDAEIVYFPENGQSEYQPNFQRRGAWTEAIETFYRFGDAIYIPHTDGAGYWEGCGYITNEGGEWHEVSLPGQAIHVFDMAQTSEGMWAVGSAIYASQADAGATLWFRPTGGDWTIRYQADTEGMGFSRFYQIRVEDDRAWVHDSITMGVTRGRVVYGFNAADMETRDVRSGEHWGRNVTDQIIIGDYTYQGGPMGKITKERKR